MGRRTQHVNLPLAIAFRRAARCRSSWQLPGVAEDRLDDDRRSKFRTQLQRAGDAVTCSAAQRRIGLDQPGWIGPIALIVMPPRTISRSSGSVPTSPPPALTIQVPQSSSRPASRRARSRPSNLTASNPCFDQADQTPQVTRDVWQNSGRINTPIGRNHSNVATVADLGQHQHPPWQIRLRHPKVALPILARRLVQQRRCLN